MEKFVIVFDKISPKKHSVRFDTTQQSAPVQSVYISQTVFDKGVPKKIKITVEEEG